jgi:fatty-acyl-CoA synthase
MNPLDVGGLLRARAHLTPRREAIHDLATAQRTTFEELDRRADAVAAGLAAAGVSRGDRVALLSKNHIAYVDVLFACARLGAILAPLNWRLTDDELAFAVADSEPSVLLHALALTDVAETLGRRRPDLRVVSIDGPTYQSWIAAKEAAQPVAVGPDDPVCLLYTSGTTGRPKGALLPHRQVVWNAISTAASWDLRADDVAPVLTPMFHAGGLFVFLTPLIHAGGRTILSPEFDPEASLRLIEAEGCTVVMAVPAILRMWLESTHIDAFDPQRVRFFVSGGAPCPPALIEAWHRRHGVVVRQGYGMTEVGVNCFAMTNEDALADVGSVGRPVLYAQARVVDAHGQEAAAGVPGELVLGGPHVCLGYWRQPEATAQVLRDGWFHTGDMATRDDSGSFRIVGRYKDMIISGGENVYAAEVEAIVREHPDVADAALVGRPDPKWGEVGWIVVKPEGGRTVNTEHLLEHCRAKLARYKIPKRVLVRDDLPYSAYGKIDKAQLRAWLDTL